MNATSQIKNNKHENNNLLENIVHGGFCIGCGACSTIQGFEGVIELNEFGMYSPSNLVQTNEVNQKVEKICPFSGSGPNEDEISKQLFHSNNNHSFETGFYNQLYAGHVNESDFRAKGTSGGIITWVLTKLIKEDLVDYVIHVKPSSKEDIFFEYGTSKNSEEIKSGAKSRYYPIEMSKVIDFIKKNNGRYVIVGLPCFVKAIRRICIEDQTFDKKIKFCIGLVCGHLKSSGFGESLGWQADISPNELDSIDFRVKLKDRPANKYGYTASTKSKGVTKPMEGIMGGNWGHNFFRYPACNYCDDVFAETADLCVGDAWLDEYTQDSFGSSVVVVRNEEILNILTKGVKEQSIQLNQLTEKKLIDSQAGGLRDRREGLAFRLSQKQKKQEWFPTKRVTPSESNLPKWRKRLYENRERVSSDSHKVWLRAKQEANFKYFSEYYLKQERIFTSLVPANKLHKRIYRKIKNLISQQ